MKIFIFSLPLIIIITITQPMEKPIYNPKATAALIQKIKRAARYAFAPNYTLIFRFDTLIAPDVALLLHRGADPNALSKSGLSCFLEEPRSILRL